MLLNGRENENMFYNPTSINGYLTPLQRKKLREKRKLDYSSYDFDDRPVNSVEKEKRPVNPKPKSNTKSKNIQRKKSPKTNTPNRCFNASQLVSQSNISVENKKFFKSRSPEHLKKAKFVVPLVCKKLRFGFGEEKHAKKNTVENAIHTLSKSTSDTDINDLCNANEEVTICPSIVTAVPIQNNFSREKPETTSSTNEIELQKLKAANVLEKIGFNPLDFELIPDVDSTPQDELAEKVPISPASSHEENQPTSPASSREENQSPSTEKKYFPVFYNMKRNWDTSPTGSKPVNRIFHTKDKSKGGEQMIIDAGQKEIGLKECKTCGMTYTIGQEEDERLHASLHDNPHFTTLKFAGWKQERVIGTYDDGRVIKILEDDESFKLKKVKDILKVANGDLGFSYSGLPVRPDVVILLFISNDKHVRGCLVAESITSASPVVLGESGNWYASAETFSAICGINRIWVSKDYQRKKVASRMVDCLRSNFIYGHVVSLQEIAFTDPTPDGRHFAASYTKTNNFLVYI